MLKEVRIGPGIIIDRKDHEVIIVIRREKKEVLALRAIAHERRGIELGVNEFGVAAPTDSNPGDNVVSATPNAGDGTGLTAMASDEDATNNTVTYSLIAGDSDFDIDSLTGVVTVDDTFNTAMAALIARRRSRPGISAWPSSGFARGSRSGGFGRSAMRS